jgi:hypothetical protein
MNSNKKHPDNEAGLKETDCYTDRKSVSTIINTEGEIFLIDKVNFGIRYKENTKPLLPCNLPIHLQKTKTKIIFSGVIKETKLEELWAAEPFVLITVEEIQ